VWVLAACLLGCGGRDGTDDIKMVFVKGDTVTLDYVSRDSTRVVILDDFYISKYETTQGLWESVMGYNPSRFQQDNPRNSARFPVENVSFDEIWTFIQKLNAKTGKRYRLPTDVEWFYAATGGKKCKGYEYFGSDDLDKVAWYRYSETATIYDTGTHPVGTKKANELGIHDMHGNVWEWTGTKEEVDSRPCRILRGGGVDSDTRECNIRFCQYDLNSRGNIYWGRDLYWGFRLARDP
jgi:formylglycine-generating enzyme required for sulfatase activity